jgi:KaiC/GvpD/RAD55 family RecA-like ATPase
MHAQNTDTEFRLLTREELFRLPALEWLIEKVVPRSGVAMIYGQMSVGKSFLALAMAAAVSEGKSWFGLPVQQCPVVYCALEGEGGIQNRVKAYCQKHGDLASKGVLYLLQPFSLLEEADVQRLAGKIKSGGAAGGMVVIDTLSHAMYGADENDFKAMGRVIAGAKALQREVGGVVLLIHHSGKDEKKGVRGHSSLPNMLDCAIEVKREKNDRRVWRTKKMRDERDGRSYRFTLSVVTLGVDCHGEAITSCVVEPVDGGYEQVQASDRLSMDRPGGKNQKIALDVILKRLRESKFVGAVGAPLDAPCITLDDAMDATKNELVGIDESKRKERAKSAIDGLLCRGWLFHDHSSGWVWTTPEILPPHSVSRPL